MSIIAVVLYLVAVSIVGIALVIGLIGLLFDLDFGRAGPVLLTVAFACITLGGIIDIIYALNNQAA